MLFGRSWSDWIAQYSSSHENPLNRFCHTIGIPLILLSLLLLPGIPFVVGFWKVPVALFVGGWIFQFVGHAFEGKAPEFFHNWRFLLVGVRWWFTKMRGRA